MTIEIREEGVHPSAHTLARMHAGELEGAELEQARAHVEQCEACQAFLDELVRTREAFDAGHDRDGFLRRVEASVSAPAGRPAPDLPWWQRLLRPVPLAAGAALLAGVLVLVLWTPPRGPGGPDRMKGGELELGYYVMQAGEPVVAGPGHRLEPGDRIQFRLTAPAGGYVHIVGIDQAGTVSVYFPLPGGTRQEFPGGAGRPVPGSVILDDTPGQERVFVLICDAPHERSALMQLAGNDPRRLLDSRRIPLPSWTCRQDSLLLHKE